MWNSLEKAEKIYAEQRKSAGGWEAGISKGWWMKMKDLKDF